MRYQNVLVRKYFFNLHSPSFLHRARRKSWMDQTVPIAKLAELTLYPLVVHITNYITDEEYCHCFCDVHDVDKILKHETPKVVIQFQIFNVMASMITKKKRMVLQCALKRRPRRCRITSEVVDGQTPSGIYHLCCTMTDNRNVQGQSTATLPKKAGCRDVGTNAKQWHEIRDINA